MRTVDYFLGEAVEGGVNGMNRVVVMGDDNRVSGRLHQQVLRTFAAGGRGV